jgi:hypothetical protein
MKTIAANERRKIMRLIDADELRKKFVDFEFVDGVRCDVDSYTLNAINKAPTVDAVPVIRCKDCRYWDGYFCHNKWWGDGHGNYTPPIKQEEGFCDWAERRE